ncbi:MAG: glutathione S-transferase [Variibacter sp.]|jgi:glutathione S-transferase|nr:glutathione S-transferase [Variibacter sp.]
MKLYYSPGACSLSPHIVSREAGLKVDLQRVDTKTKKLADGGDYFAVNPKGMVPVLQLDDGDYLTEGPAIVQYLADQAPNAKLIPPAGSKERYRVLEWLNYITSEIHKSFSPLFKPNTPDEYKTISKENLAQKFGYIDQQLAGKKYLTGDQFTVADAYLFTVLNWTKFHHMDLAQWPNIAAFMTRVRERPHVQEALKAEGLLQAKAA